MSESSTFLSTAILAAHWLIVLAVSLRIINRRMPVGVSLAWLSIVYAVPFGGAAAYLVLGGKQLDNGWIARHSAAERSAEETMSDARKSRHAVSVPAGNPGQLLWRETMGTLGTPALAGNRLRMLTDFESVFDALIADIDAAQVSCRLAFYIWHDGGRTQDVETALIRAHARGVRCRVLVDAFGSSPFLKRGGSARLLAAGVEVVAALPSSFLRRADIRYHRKNVVIDDHIAYTGSQNLVDPRYFKQNAGVGKWVDAMVRMEGPAVSLQAHLFEVDWAADSHHPCEPTAMVEEPSFTPGVVVQVVPSGPAPVPDVIRRLTLTAIYAARRTLTITTPYFVPDDAVLTALQSAAWAGVQVTLIVPAMNDSFLVHHASASIYENVLAAGVRIFQHRGGLLHTKSIVVDGVVTLFGSVNLDMRSFWLDFEISLFIYDEAFAEEMHALQREYMQSSTQLDSESWRLHPHRNRLFENAARLIGPLL